MVETRPLAAEHLPEVDHREVVDVPSKQVRAQQAHPDLQDNLDHLVKTEPLENLARQEVLDLPKSEKSDKEAASNAKLDPPDPLDLMAHPDPLEIMETQAKTAHQETEEDQERPAQLVMQEHQETMEPQANQVNQARQEQDLPPSQDQKDQVEHQDQLDNLANRDRLLDQAAPDQQDPLEHPVAQDSPEATVNRVALETADPRALMPHTAHVQAVLNLLPHPEAVHLKDTEEALLPQLPLQPAKHLLLHQALLVDIVAVLLPLVELLLVNKPKLKK